MKKYNSYRDSGIEWIGEIPVSWKSIKIKRLTPVKRGASPRPIDDPKFFDDDGEYSWVRIADVSASERYLQETTQKLSELGASLSVKREPGDFFLSIAGTVGKPIITKIRCCIHDGFVYFPDLEINPEYLYYVFSTGLPYQGLGKWGTQLNLNTETVGEIVIPLPREIDDVVTYLDRKTAEIDELIADKKRLLELYEEEKTAIINQAVTKGINPDAPMKYSGIEWLGEIPEHWQVKRLKYIIKGFESGVSVNSIDNPISEGESGILKTSCVYDYTFRPEKNKLILNDSELERAKTNPKKGRIIISRMNTPELVGASGYVEKDYPNLFLPDRLWQTVFHDNVVFDSKWLSFILKCMNFRKLLSTLATGTSPSMKNIGQEDVLSIPVPYPEKTEQQSIVHHIETECSRIDTQVERTKKLIELLKEYRQALISEVVTGKIKVVPDPVSTKAI